MPGIGGTATTGAETTNTLKSFGGLLPALPKQGILNTASGILGIATSASPLGAVAFGIGTITNIFTRHHQQALKTEGDTLNAVDPAFRDALAGIVGALNAGQIDRQTASGLVDQAVQQYDSQVSAITNNPGASADSAKCNAACYIRVHYILPWASAAKQIIASGGTANFGPIPSHETQSGLAAFSLTVNANAGTPGQAGQAPPPISSGLPNQGQTPTAIGGVGTPVGGGTIVPYSSQSGATPGVGAVPAPVGQESPAGGSQGTEAFPNKTLLIGAALVVVGVLAVVGIVRSQR